MARVLLVDDDSDACALLALHLERRGHQVQSAGTIAEGKAALANDSFDALVADLELPDGRGHHLLASGRPQSLRLALVLTGYRDDADRRATSASGFDAHLEKPVDAREIVRLLDERIPASAATR